MNINHINFDYKLYAAQSQITETDAKHQYMCTTLPPELKLISKDINEFMSMSYAGKIESLQSYIIKEDYLSYIYTTLDKSKTTRDISLVLIEKCIPCSLHLDL